MSKEDRLYLPVVSSLNIASKKVRKRALNHMNKLDYRKAGLGPGDLCKYHACVEIAARQLQEPFSRELALRKSSASAELYQDTFSMVCNTLEIAFDLSLQELAELVSASPCVDTARSIQEHFKKRFEAQLPKVRTSGEAHFSETLLGCCAVTLASEIHHLSITELDMLVATSCSVRQYYQTLKQVRELTLKLLFPSGQVPSSENESELIGGAPPRKKQKGANGEASKRNSSSLNQDMDKPPKITLDMPIDKNLEETIKKQDAEFVEKLMKTCLLSTPATSMNSPSVAEKRRIDDETYKEWRETIIESNSNAKTLAKPPFAAKKQTTIPFARATSSHES